MSRRDFLVRTGAAGLTVGLAGTVESLFTSLPAAGARGPARGYGPLVPDPAGILDLPEGFSYRILSREGQPMASGGGPVPGRHDGMGSFRASGGRTHLVRNHELGPGAPHPVPAAGQATAYDPTAFGGTTNLVVDDEGQTVEEYVSLSGTAINCSGGITPWGTWLTCEENEEQAGGASGYSKDHGWVFEVDPYDNRRNTEPFPLTDMGRFMHEAVAVDPDTGVLYETEDAFSGGELGSYYRFLPNKPLGGYGSLRAGGRLQALHVPGLEDLSTVQETGATFGGIEWLDVPDPTARRVPVRAQKYRKPLTRGQKLEGAWWGSANHSAYFVSSFADAAPSAGRHDGQVWRYDPRSNSLTLELVFTGAAADDVYERPDNMCVSPYGGLMICEDSSGENYMLGTTADGRPFVFARNRQVTTPGETGELSGVSFSPDGKVMYFNVYDPGTTFAVTGPWRRQG